MKTTPIVLAFVACSLCALPAVAQEEGVTVVSSQFTDKIESSKPVGDASSIGATATYFVVASNNKADATQITLVWKLDDKEVGRQTLDVGKSPSWRTWGSFATRKAHTVAVDVLDKDGKILKSDTMTVAGR